MYTCAGCGADESGGAAELLQCNGSCAGASLYCGRSCQKKDWRTHRQRYQCYAVLPARPVDPDAFGPPAPETFFGRLSPEERWLRYGPDIVVRALTYAPADPAAPVQPLLDAGRRLGSGSFGTVVALERAAAVRAGIVADDAEWEALAARQPGAAPDVYAIKTFECGRDKNPFRLAVREAQAVTFYRRLEAEAAARARAAAAGLLPAQTEEERRQRCLERFYRGMLPVLYAAAALPGPNDCWALLYERVEGLSLEPAGRPLALRDRGAPSGFLTLAPGELLRVLYELMAFVHLSVLHWGLVHEDLKGANLLYTGAVPGALRRVRVLDFGVACYADLFSADPARQRGRRSGLPDPGVFRTELPPCGRAWTSLGTTAFEGGTLTVPEALDSWPSEDWDERGADAFLPSTRDWLHSELWHVGVVGWSLVQGLGGDKVRNPLRTDRSRQDVERMAAALERGDFLLDESEAAVPSADLRRLHRTINRLLERRPRRREQALDEDFWTFVCAEAAPELKSV